MLEQDTTLAPAQMEHIKEESDRFKALHNEVSKVIVGQEDIITAIATAILSNGHILLEGVPGVAKTTMIKAVTNALGLTFNRIQFTPDLLPADLIGTMIYNAKTQDFETRQGPIFANLILADEINRAPAKVQAALLEAMQERQVTIGSTTYKLDEPFLVFATQNPIEQEGTYRLPEAQIDRFMFKLLVSYPTKEQEREIIRRKPDPTAAQCVLNKDSILAAQKLVGDLYLDDKVANYIVDLVFASRDPKAVGLDAIAQYITYGVSPRATLALQDAARAHAFLKRRHFVTPDDVKAVAPPIFRHRLALSYEAEADGIQADTIIKQILNTVPTP